MNDFRERIAAFLRQYVETTSGGLLPVDDVYIKDGIALLIENDIMSKEEIRVEALSDYNVIIPDSYFP